MRRAAGRAGRRVRSLRGGAARGVGARRRPAGRAGAAGGRRELAAGACRAPRGRAVLPEHARRRRARASPDPRLQQCPCVRHVAALSWRHARRAVAGAAHPESAPGRGAGMRSDARGCAGARVRWPRPVRPRRAGGDTLRAGGRAHRASGPSRTAPANRTRAPREPWQLRPTRRSGGAQSAAKRAKPNRCRPCRSSAGRDQAPPRFWPGRRSSPSPAAAPASQRNESVCRDAGTPPKASRTSGNARRVRLPGRGEMPNPSGLRSSADGRRACPRTAASLPGAPRRA